MAFSISVRLAKLEWILTEGRNGADGTQGGRGYHPLNRAASPGGNMAPTSEGM